MRVLVIVLVIVALLALGAAFFVKDLGARGELVADSFLERIDRVLGKLAVERKAITLAMEKVKSDIEAMRRTRIQTTVKAERLDREIKSLEESVQQIDQTLSRLRTKLTGSAPVEIAGRTYSVDDIQRTSDRLITLRKNKAGSISGLQEAQLVMQKTAEGLGQKQIVARDKVERFKSQLAAIDAKSVALKALQSSYAVGNSTSLSNQLAGIEEKIEALLVNVETELRVEGEKWDEAAVENDISSVDTLLQDLKEPAETVAEIDAILGDRLEVK
ncbi:MAG: hypothetical protein ABIH36_02140 [bacterium]